MLEDKKLGLKVTESKDEAIWSKLMEQADKQIANSRVEIEVQQAVKELAQSKLELVKKSSERAQA